MSMKKMLALLLALVMVLSLAACAGSGEKDDKKNDDTKAPAANQEKDPTGDSKEDSEKPGLNDELPTTDATDEPVVDEPSDEPNDEPGEGPVDRPMPGAPDAVKSIVAFVEANGAELAASAEESFTSVGMTCTSTVEAIGSGIVITVCVNELNDVPEEDKAAMQETFDAMAELMEGTVEMMQTEIPELTYMAILVCDVDGDILATIYVGE